MTDQRPTEPPGSGEAEPSHPEPVRGEPPILSHDPASVQSRDTSVRAIDGTDGTDVGTIVGAAGAAVAGASGPVQGLARGQATPLPVDDRRGGRVRRGGRDGRGWLVVATTLAVGGVALLALALLTDGGTDAATGTAPSARLSTPILSVRRDPELLARPVALRNVQEAIAPVLRRFPNASCVLVTDGAMALAASSDTTPLAPASNVKLLTASAALSVLGADTRLETTVSAAAAPTGGTVAGDLFLVGGGDPLLSTTTAESRMRHGKELTSSLEALADQVAATGVRRVDGAVVGDGSRYDELPKVPEHPQRYVTDGTIGNLGGLIVNDAWTIDPTDAGGSKGAPAPDPATHAAEVFTMLLKARGVQVTGTARSGTAPEDATEIATLPSPTIGEIVSQMVTFSDNTTAEMLIKELAAHDGSTGTTEGGIQVLVADLTTRGLPVDGLELRDGSGLSRDDRATCRLIDAVIAADGADGPIAKGLARPGQSGTLDDRFLSAPLSERLSAKTGTLNDVTALSGWVRTDSGRPLAFSTVQNPVGRQVQASDLALQAQLLQALLSYPQTPPADQLSPAPPTGT